MEPDPAHVLLTSPVRRRILEVLEGAEPRDPGRLGHEGMTAAQLAKQLSLHVTTVRFHLDQLVAAGLLETSFHKHIGAGRPRKVYARVAPAHPPATSQESLGLLAELLTGAFTAQVDGGVTLTPEQAGRRWAEEHVGLDGAAPATTAGEWIAKLGRTIDVLTSWGYEPELVADGAGRDARIELTSCPFRDLARAHTEVVCGIHRGLIAGTMSRLGEPDTGVELFPFADGQRCIARIRALPENVPDRPDSHSRDPDRPTTTPPPADPTTSPDPMKETR